MNKIAMRVALAAIAGVVSVSLAVPPAAAQYTWTGPGTNWNTAANWSPATGPPNSSSATVSFTGNALGIVNLTSSVSTQSLSFSNPTGNYTLLSNAGVTLDSVASITVAAAVTGVETINLANIPASGSLLFPSGNLTVTNNSTAAGTTLVIGPNTVIGTPGFGGVVFAGAGTTQLSGNFATSAAFDPVGGLTMNGTGKVILSNPTNKYTGGTVVNAGTLAVGANGAVIPAGTTVQVAAGATFDLGPYTNGSANALLAVTLTGGTLRATGATNSDFYTQQLTMTGGTIDFTNLPFTWIHLTGSGGITTNTAATTATWLGASSSLSRVENDTASPMTITVAAGAPNGIDLDAGIALSGSGTNPTFVKAGPGTMRLTNTGNTANITVNQGILRVDDMTANGVGALGTGSVITLGAATLQYGGPTAPTTKNLTLTGSGTIQVLTDGANLTFGGTINQSGSQPLRVYGPATAGASSTLTITSTQNYSGATTVDGNAVLAITTIGDALGGAFGPLGGSSPAVTNLVLSTPGGYRGTLLLTGTAATYHTDRGGTLGSTYPAGGAIGVASSGTNLTWSGQLTGTGSFVKTGAGQLTLTNAANSYMGGTYVEAGTLTVGATGPVIPTAYGVTVAAGATFHLGTAASNYNPTQIYGASITLNGGTLSSSATGNYFAANLVMTGGTVDFSSITTPYLSFDLNIFDNPGITTNASSTTATWIGGSGAAIANANYSAQIINVAAGSTANGIDLDAGIRLDTPQIVASPAFAKAGTGTMRLTNLANSSDFIVRAGALRVDDLTGGVGPLGTGALTLNGGRLAYGGPPTTLSKAFSVDTGGGAIDVLSAATTLTVTSPITSNGVLTKSGPGVLVLNNLANSFAGGITVSGGRLDVSDDAQLGLSNPTVNALGTLRYNADATSARTFTLNAGVLEAPAGVTLTLNGAAIGGGFLRGAGAFVLTNGTALNGVTTLTSTTLAQTGTVAVTNFSNGGNFTVSAGQTLSWNGGANTTTGRLTVTGTANVSDFASDGQLTIPSGGMVNNSGSPLFLGGGSRTTINPSGTLSAAAGTTLELNGGLLVNNGTISGTTDVNYGSLAKGTGVYGIVNVGQGGTYAPGNSPGIVTAAAVNFDNTPVISGAPVLQIELAGTTLGTQYDQLAVTGQASLGGTLALLPLNGFVPDLGDKFVVMTYANRSGTFSSVTGTTPAPGLTYSAVYLPTSLVVLTTTTGDMTWGVDSDGTASSGANWIGGIAPGGVGDSAAFTTIITAPRTVTIDADTTIGTLKFDSSNSYLIAGPHTLTLQAAGVTAAAMNISGVHGNGAHTISAPITLASDLNITQNSSGLFTLFGVLDDAAGKQINVLGSGTTVIVGSINLGNATALSVGGTGSLRFGLTTGAATIGTGVTVTINNSATLELAGSVSALSSATNRANVTNSSNAAAGILVSGTNQQVGGIDGSGTTQVNTGSDLAANHIIQSALVIGGTSKSFGLVTIDASDASGNPLGQTSGLALAGSLTPIAPFGAGGVSSANLNGAGGGTDPSVLSTGNSAVGGNPSSVPEPSTLLLALLAVLGVVSKGFARHHFRCQTD
jgi:fibronectin-binding autotransporter adhesin